jgi:hypothetical protein
VDIESRIANLDADMSSVKTELAVLRSNHVTKDDVAKLVTKDELTAVNADLATVKADLGTVKLDVAVIRATYATKEDLLKAINTLTWKMYCFGTLLVAVVYFIAKNVN